MSWTRLILWAACLSILAYMPGCSPAATATRLSAAIVDQLDAVASDQHFVKDTSAELEKSGFNVDVYQGDRVTVDLYAKLAEARYRLIILRVHSGLLGVDPKTKNLTWLFTNEPYNKTSYLVEQLTDRATYARTPYSDWVFAINARFIENNIKRNFDKAVVVMMGCDGMHYDDLAKAFIGKGSSAYIGWDASVTLDHSDASIPGLISNLCCDQTLNDSITKTMRERGPDPVYRSVLRFYPQSSGSKSFRQLAGF